MPQIRFKEVLEDVWIVLQQKIINKPNPCHLDIFMKTLHSLTYYYLKIFRKL